MLPPDLYIKLQNLRNELFFIINERDHTFMHLNIIDKLLYIPSSEINTCTIAKFINFIKCINHVVVFYITLNLILCDFYIIHLHVHNHSDSQVIKHSWAFSCLSLNEIDWLSLERYAHLLLLYHCRWLHKVVCHKAADLWKPLI